MQIFHDLYSKYVSEKYRYKVSVLKSLIRRLVVEKKLIIEQQVRNEKMASLLRNKRPVKVCFFAQLSSVWKYDLLYKLMDEDPCFEPMVLVVPELGRGDEFMWENMNRTYQLMKSKGYRVLNSFDKSRNSWVNVHTQIEPDIIFFSRPYSGISKKEYAINNFPDILTCYVPYAFMEIQGKAYFDLLFHNLLWIHFAETIIHKQISYSKEFIKAKNVYVSGYPGCDLFLLKNRTINDCWKIKNPLIKRIIWAPHHSIGNGGYTDFLKVYDLFMNLAVKYRGRIQIAFKPHPLLKSKLYNCKGWGNKKTDSYYDFWRNSENTFLVEGEYIDLFLTSDALMHDSGSFLIEYLYTLKPVLFSSFSNRRRNLNNFGKLALDLHYRANSEDGIMTFIEDIVIKNNDYMYDQRKLFFDTYLNFQNGMTASCNIVKKIKEYL